ncbi:membrane protein [Clostridium sp. DMHC 10]|uniref:PDZ domain-containing protein n=1 Tax=Clostridium sp. DMHC 10 TaxID=747377 RepID=UPI00069DAC63|nr:PDZ domain-containing protein [Clostridium sp. DMHC 10]KOF58066.1 membrane protein [Clostridium sp. DMHC 10]
MNIIMNTLIALSKAILTPSYVLILIIMTVIFYRRNTKTTLMQKMIIGDSLKSPLELTLSQILLGMLAGTLGSVLLSCFGVVFKDDGAIFLLFIISIFLMLMKSRFICFSYSGALVGIVSLTISGMAANGVDVSYISYLQVDVNMLMCMVAILHIVEGILVLLDGKSGVIPVFTNRDNKIIGGFAFKRYWLLPVAMLFMLTSQDFTYIPQMTASQVWSFIKGSSLTILKDSAIGFGAFYGILGYSTYTFTKTKTEKIISSGISIISYGSVLLILSLLLKNNVFEQFLLCILAPAMHEIMLRLQMYMEMSGKPRYINNDEGIMVLEVAPNSPAYEMGIKSGDILVELNDTKIVNEEDILKSLSNVTNYIWLKIKNVQGKLSEVSYNNMNSTKKLGLVFVPKIVPEGSRVMKVDSESFDDILEKAKKK